MAYRLRWHPRRPDHPALIDERGEATCTWSPDQTRETIAGILAAGGFTLHPDDTVTPNLENPAP